MLIFSNAKCDSFKKKKPKRVIIVAENLNNIGDLALLLQCVDGLKRHVGLSLFVVRQWESLPDDIVQVLAAKGINYMPAKNWFGMLKAATGALIVVGGGQAIRPNGGVRALIALFVMVLWTRLSGGDVVLLGCGLDLLKEPLRRFIWRNILVNAKLVTVRDNTSHQIASNLVKTAKVILTADLMFMPSSLHSLLNDRGGERLVVVAPCVDTSEGRVVIPQRIADVACRACDITRTNRICLVAQDARPHMDMQIITQISDQIKHRRPDIEIKVLAGEGLSAALRVYAASHLTITNRLHPAIFTLIAERPVLIFEDGTSKLSDIVDYFMLARTRTELPDESTIHSSILRQEIENGPSLNRRALLDKAAEAANQNFTLLIDELYNDSR